MEQCVGGMDGSNDLGGVLVREAGCGVVYVLNLEDREETQFEIDLNREQAEKLYLILGKMLDITPAPPNWTKNAVSIIPKDAINNESTTA
jgi:K+/H+ antiporter YhaU regulatory subunit KhtT